MIYQSDGKILSVCSIISIIKDKIMSNIIGNKKTRKELKQISIYDYLRKLDALNLSFKGIRKRNIYKLIRYTKTDEYKHLIPSNWLVLLSNTDYDNYNKTISSINEKLKELKLNKLEYITDTIHQRMVNPQFISINPKTYKFESLLFDEFRLVMRSYWDMKLGKKWYNKMDKIPDFFLFEENGRARDVEQHHHYHLLIDLPYNQAKELKDYILQKLSKYYKAKSYICDDFESVGDTFILYDFSSDEKHSRRKTAELSSLEVIKTTHLINSITGEVKYKITCQHPKYPKLDIDLTPVIDDGIYSYSIKEAVSDQKRVVYHMDVGKIGKIYNKNDILFYNSLRKSNKYQ